MLLQITKFITVAIAVLAVVFSLSSSFEAPLWFMLDDQYRVEAYNKSTVNLTAEYKGITYSNVTVTPKSFYLDMGELPFPDYVMLVLMLLALASVFILLELIIRILKSIETRDFFTHQNVKRIRFIGLMVVGFSVLKWGYGLFLNTILFDVFHLQGVSDVGSFSFSLNFFNSTFFWGLMILLVANAFEHGLKIKQEQDLTI